MTRKIHAVQSTSQYDGREQFLRDVFPAELEEINKRRGVLHLPEFPPNRAPSAKLGLVGLALSGGGIRSATLSLGVIQALAKNGLLKTVDYLSTVSGGGFIGSCLSSLLNDKDVGTEQDRFPLHYKVGTKEPLAVGQLRQGARYLASGGVLDKLRIPALILRGVLSNLLRDMRFGGLVKLLIYARIDLGIEIDIDLDNLRKDEQGFSSEHWVLGTIRYADDETGYLLYIKSSLTGDESEYIRKYRLENPIFPHESTAGQFFTETRFEAYRGLGYHIGNQLFSNNETLGEFKSLKQQPSG